MIPHDLTWSRHDLTWPHIISHDITWPHNLTWSHMTSHNLTISHDIRMTSHNCTWSHMTSHDLTWHYYLNGEWLVFILCQLQYVWEHWEGRVWEDGYCSIDHQQDRSHGPWGDQGTLVPWMNWWMIPWGWGTAYEWGLVGSTSQG